MSSFTAFKGGPDGYPVQSTSSRPEKLTGDLVFVKVAASGVCGTDLHFRQREHMVLGHEGVGVVEETGPAVKHIKKGDRVGWGYLTNSCGVCIECLQGNEIYCPDRTIYGNGNFEQGSFATHTVQREAFVFKLPDSISDEDAAPLQCAGATVFTALLNVKPNETVGIIGVGGLGHLAIQFAAKLGCRVVVLSSSDRKKDEAAKLGAHHFIATKGQTKLDLQGAPKLSRLLVTTAFLPDWDLLLPIMAPNSSIYPLTASRDNLSIPSLPLIQGGISIVGSLVASRAVQIRMLEFAAFHKITPVTEKFPMTEEGIKEAVVNMDKGNLHFKAVLIPQ